MSVEMITNRTVSPDSARTQIAGAIQQAAGQTGTSFEYLLTTAKMESNFDPSAKASTSSAGGLFQFIDQTWLGTVKEAGAALGYGQYAAAIQKSASGSYSVADPAAKAEIMKLRDDPAAASAMAGVLTQSNSFKLIGNIGRRPNDAELYMAHFMGVGGASKLINAAVDTPNVSGAALFPSAAAANQSIFYDRSGAARSVSGVYVELSRRYEAASQSSATQTAMAAVGGAGSAAAAPIDNAAYLSSFPDIRNVRMASSSSAPRSATETTALQFAASPSPASPTVAQQSEPIFRTLFLGGDRSEPVSAAVRDLWVKTNAVGALQTAPTVRPPTTPDLFSDRSGAFSG
ncbi:MULTISPECIES: transglycosylase SLT domain-containing protein [Rhodopseudomonas]|uniref:Transglycosylase n=1 Tax=Rhodopseudomonas palustris TaxID=1076 RepID=A0A0D7DZF8_RHOPL|nr:MULTISPECIES: transglycosylase SLT domain-containing protein [Rhodopseudomonas]KIZ33656.1 transglycosylase [Rhodopseudomonas palustris]MDF3810425.1 transglycosylase SLT domain-containing protein [Rhodopseudomonas sp. BAL398]WOK19595.1 transglycosylase SLT domain-containing protein [Rhodopseudomonas sp. BAL398]